VQKARDHGCNVGRAPTLNELMKILHQWGVDDVQASCTIEQYDQVIRLGLKQIPMDAPVGRGGLPPTPLVDGQGPFYAIEVQPS
jgi:hypothetical protein